MGSSYWAEPKEPRDQLRMLYPTLEDVVEPDAEIRVFEALLEEVDWRPWEAKYDGKRGQPPVHPRLLAGAILYGLTKRARSSREVERATRHWTDMMWFLEGRTLDHSTICEFRERFGEELLGLFKEMGQRASAGREAGRWVAVDGTRVRAHSARQGARTAKRLRESLSRVGAQREALLSEMARRDASDDAAEALEEAEEDGGDVSRMRQHLEKLEAQQAKLSRALAIAEQRDAAKQAHDGPKATAVRVPVTDPEAHVLPHKEGGFGPNWTATVAVDIASGALLDARVVEGSEEASALVPAVEAVRQIHGRDPEALLADGNFSTGPALQGLDQEGVALLSPSPPTVDPSVAREDLSQPVEAERHQDLPTEGRGEKIRLSHEAFVYDAPNDCYYCPQGQVLRRVQSETRRDKSGQAYQRWRYRCAECSGCPLAPRCLKGEAKGRTVIRDEYQPYRDQLARRMEDPAAQALYKKRAPVAEGVFGYIKYVMGVRQFLYRGTRKVDAEWRWICTAFNVGKILRRARAKALVSAPDEPTGSGAAAEGQGGEAESPGGGLKNPGRPATALVLAFGALWRALAPHALPAPA